ncbi:MAG: single-stranded DNA-binding protein [Lachnospiraceae bacterium]|jgi:single-strand DNA-binding protein|nr:single-stranded DNA-binding protein [Lachnospiraceae bacterium]MCI1328120.1 single-stranded DNA-binding protein [Lachnospiraceae bacterium]
MNKVILMGRLTRDPDIRYSQGENGTQVARYTLAVDRRFRRQGNDGQQSADFISCVAFGKSAEFAERYFHKGIKIIVTGRLQTGSYTNRDGARVYTTDVVVEDQEFAESKSVSDGTSSAYRAPEGGGQRPDRSSEIGSDSAEGFMNIPDGIDEELPFK